MSDPVDMQELFDALMIRQLKEHGIFEGVVAMFNAKQIEIERLREALRDMDKATISHVDGRDLLDELHPRHTLDIKRRIDGIETWYEGDWLSRLKDARDAARAALGEGKE